MASNDLRGEDDSFHYAGVVPTTDQNASNDFRGEDDRFLSSDSDSRDRRREDDLLRLKIEL